MVESRLKRFILWLWAVPVLVLAVAGGRAWGQDYLLGPGDELHIVVLGDTDLTRTVTVTPDGKISLPLSGEIAATGLTPAQVGERLTKALKPYFKDPRVTVTLSKPRGAFVFLVGQVRIPGSYEMQPGWTVIEAVTKAGGLTEKAAGRQAVLIRRTSNQSIPLDLDTLITKGDQSANIVLEVGDVILVPELKKRVLVLGHVRSPGAYELKDGARLLDAIAAAGGTDTKAALRSVSVARQTPQASEPARTVEASQAPQMLPAAQTSPGAQTPGAYAPVAIVDVGKMLDGNNYAQNLELQNADIVYVPSTSVTFSDVVQFLSGIDLVLRLFHF